MTTSKAARMVAILAAYVCSFNTVLAESLNPELVLKIRRVSDLQLSPNENRVAFTVSEPIQGTEQNRNIWILELGSETTWQLTRSKKSDLFMERSPVTHLKDARTPTLILCGEKDVIDPIGQCTEFYRGLKRYGVETELVVYPREGHGIREERHQIDLLQRIVDWFDRNLMNAEKATSPSP